MNKLILPTVEIEPSQKANASIIFLHGLGADGHDFAPIVPQIQLSKGIYLRYIFPHAPVRPVTLNGGVAMRAWYDISVLDDNVRGNDEDIRESAELIANIIRQETERGIP